MAGNYDVIVVGVGSMGSAACCHLARRGVRVLGLEQFGIPHASGSHHGHSRMIRLAYYEHPDYVPLLRRAYACWEHLEAQSGQKLLHVTGGVYIGRLDGELVGGSLQSCIQHELDHELLDARELKQRFPVFHVPEDCHALFEPQAGFLLPERVVAAHARLALEAGAELHGLEPVREWSRDGKHLVVVTDRSSYTAERIVFAAGAWTARLLQDLGVPLRVTRQVLAWYWPRNPKPFQLGTFPCWFVESEAGWGHYGFPMFAESLGFKVALHRAEGEVDPASVDRDHRAADVEGLSQFLQQRIPDAAGPLLSTAVCLYTNSPDSHFIVDRWPTDPRVLLACGFSGHGFKFSSVIGQALADLATGDSTELPIEFLGLSRFAG